MVYYFSPQKNIDNEVLEMVITMEEVIAEVNIQIQLMTKDARLSTSPKRINHMKSVAASLVDVLGFVHSRNKEVNYEFSKEKENKKTINGNDKW